VFFCYWALVYVALFVTVCYYATFELSNCILVLMDLGSYSAMYLLNTN